MQDKRLCAIQVDLDGLWVLKRLLGEDAPVEPDPVFDHGVAGLLGLFDECGIKATFFAAARDLESRAKVALLRTIAGSGHEIACHGLDHRYIAGLSAEERRNEIVAGKKRIEDAIGIGVSGFKAAGFAAHSGMVADLEVAGYLYDSSVFGTSLGFMMAVFSGVHYHYWRMMTAPNAPYRPSRGDIFKKGDSGIVELPVTVMPWLRLPIHFSYSMLAGSWYAAASLKALDIAGSRCVTYLFHPLDMVDGDSVRIGRNVHGLSIRASVKRDAARKALTVFKEKYRIVTSRWMCEEVKGCV